MRPLKGVPEHQPQAIPGDAIRCTGCRQELASLKFGVWLIWVSLESGQVCGAQIAARAEELHAEHHSGVIVPSLDSCDEHTRAEYESLVADLLAGAS